MPLHHEKDYRYALAPTSQFFFCGVPFRLDTAPKCPLNCSYCFAMSRGGRRTSEKLIINPSRVKRKIDRLTNLENGDKTDIVDQLLLNKLPIHFGGMSDPFASPEIIENSIELLKVFGSINYPIVISTKNTNILTRNDIFDLVSTTKNLIIQVSISFLDEVIANRIEPGVPTPSERLKALEILNFHGVYTIARIQPLLPTKIEEVKNEIIPRLGYAGVKHIILEYLKLPVEKELGLTKDLFTNLKWDGFAFYEKNRAEKVGREWILPTKYKWDSLQPLITQIHNYGMTYGAADYGLYHLGDTDCCCGVDRSSGFSNWNKNNFSNWIKNNRTNVIMIDESIEKQIPLQSIKMYINSNSRVTGSNSLYSYLKDKWNRPGTVNAPDTYLGVKWSGDFDEKANCIYIKDQNI